MGLIMPPEPQNGDINTRIALLEANIKAKQETERSNSDKLDVILARLERLSVLEERQAVHHEDFRKVEQEHRVLRDALSEAQKRISTLELETTAYVSYAKGQNKLLYAMMGVAGSVFIKVLFFASANGMTF